MVWELFESLDFLAPPIGLNYRGVTAHYSVVSTIASIIDILLIIASCIYCAWPYIKKKDPTFVMGEAFLQKGEKNYMDIQNILHTLNVFSLNLPEIENPIEFDFTSFRVIGVNTDLPNYNFFGRDIELFDHWIYGPCDIRTYYKDFAEDFDENENIIYNESICIRQYYNSIEKKYYSTNDSNFIWPNMTNTLFKFEEKPYTIIIEKCQQDTLDLIMGKGYYCKNDSKIRDNIDKGIYYFINYQDFSVDINDYNEPNKKFINNEILTLYNNYYYSSDLYFTHVSIKTYKGLFSQSSETINVYNLEDTKTNFHPIDKEENWGLYGAFIFHINNKFRYYERGYISFIDFLYEVGGLATLINGLTLLLISFYNDYQILSDTRKLISSFYNNLDKEVVGNEKNKIDLVNDTIADLQKDDSHFKVDIPNIYNNTNNNTNNNINNNDIYNNVNINNDNKNEINNIKPLPDTMLKRHDSNNNKILKNNKNRDEENNEEASFYNIKNKSFNCCSYLCHKLTCQKKYPHYKVYEDFRTKILSEEQLMKNHIYVHNLTNYVGVDKTRKIISLKEIVKNKE